MVKMLPTCIHFCCYSLYAIRIQTFMGDITLSVRKQHDICDVISESATIQNTHILYMVDCIRYKVIYVWWPGGCAIKIDNLYV